MNQEQDQRQCAICGESEPSFIHSVGNLSVIRRLCTDCLLKEHRELFCPVCLNVFVEIPPTRARIMCLDCPSITHLSCYPRPSSSSAAAAASSSASSFTCPPCSDPNFSFFPKSRSDQNGENDDDGSGTPLDTEAAKALVAAAIIAADSMKKAAAHMKKESTKKILVAKDAKKRAKEALGNLHELVNQTALDNNNNPNKRKDSER